MPLKPPPPQRIPGRLSALGPLPHPEALLELLSPEELASWESSFLPKLDHSHDGQHGLTAR
ncbi:hypothetical protein OAK57_03240 [Synechococcus sp. AH-551-N23]|nr:hypothetical protein [Synechococcus sp. AH-551-N23]